MRLTPHERIGITEAIRSVFGAELDLYAELLRRIGDQKVDIPVHERGQPRTPIERIAGGRQ